MHQDELHGGQAPWSTAKRIAHPSLDRDLRCEVLVVGAGITGAMVAEHLAGRGRDVCLIDRERPGYGSTAASTALLLWELDSPLGRLTDLYGFERAADIYRHSLRAVAGLRQLIASHGMAGLFRDRQSLYLAADEIHARDLLAEQALRERAGLPSRFLDYRALKQGYAIEREAAILSQGAGDVDPLVLARALVSKAKAHGAATFDAEALVYESTKDGVAVELSGGAVIEARHVVLATGYTMPALVKCDHHSISSTFAIATPPLPASCWHDGVLIWEASENYLYARTTQDGRIIIGGEDEDDVIEPAARDALIPAKRAALLDKLRQFCSVPAVAEHAWAGSFGHTDDSLPLIGPVPGHPQLLAAYGYGGNGITFSFLASRVIERLIAGAHEPWFDDYALDRDLP
jgi:glycine/D-amino acid oxidase-like deaminating enzyme